MVAVGGSDIDRVGGGFLNPASDSLVMDQDALSAGGVSDCWEGEGEGGRLVGRKMEGRSAYITTTYRGIERVADVCSILGM
jgi:hypothetical protein